MSAIRVPQSNSPLEGTWRDRVTRWKASGLNVRAFCRSEGLSEPSFYSWRRTIAERDAATTSAASTPAFVPLTVVPVSAPPILELVLRSGHLLRIPHGYDPEQLRQVLAALEVASC